jgi:tRNA(adenine34) deaminase
VEERSDIIYMRQALVQAEMARDRGEVPIGAVVVCGDRVVGRAHNLVERLSDPTAHAEMQAITAATASMGGKYLNECTLYVTLEPCPMCAGALHLSHLGRLVYGASDHKRGYTTVSEAILHPKTTITTGICANECRELLTSFFQQLR